MSDDRSSVIESDEKKFQEKNCQDNDESTEIAVEVPEVDSSTKLCGSPERNSLRTTKRVFVSSQQFSWICQNIPDYLIDGIKQDFSTRKNSGNSDAQQLTRSKENNPGTERDEESTYFSEPIHHERIVVRDRKNDKFIPSEVAKDTGTRSQSTVEYHDEVDCDKGNDDNCKQGFTSSSAMDKSLKSVINESQQIVGEASTLSVDKDQKDHNSTDVPKVEVPSDFHESPELKRKFSRTNAVRDDARKLKAATLDRMGKMFKLKSTQTSSKESHEESQNSEIPKDSYVDQQSRKEKTNSLGRMFKLVDKNGEPRKLFPQSRTGSLSHILRRKSTGTEVDNTTENGNNRGLFSRLLNQWKNRSVSGNATAEPNLCASTEEEDKSSVKPSLTSRINLSSSCTNQSPISTLRAPISPLVNIVDVKYSA